MKNLQLVFIFVICVFTFSCADNRKDITTIGDIDFYISSGQQKEAELLLRQQLQNDSKNKGIRLLLGVLYTKSGLYEEALIQFQNVNNTTDISEEYFDYLLEVAYFLKDKSFLSTFSNNLPKSNFNVFLVNTINNDTFDTEVLSNGVTSSDISAFANLINKISDATDRESQLSILEEMDSFYKSKNSLPNEWFYLVTMANLYSNAGKFADSIKYYSDYLTLRPHNLAAKILNTLAYFQLGEYEKANQQSSELLKSFPNVPMLNYLKSLASFKLLDFQESALFADKLLDASIEAEQLLSLSGVSHFQLGNYERAIQRLNKLSSLRQLSPQEETLVFYINAFNANEVDVDTLVTSHTLDATIKGLLDSGQYDSFKGLLDDLASNDSYNQKTLELTVLESVYNLDRVANTSDEHALNAKILFRVINELRTLINNQNYEAAFREIDNRFEKGSAYNTLLTAEVFTAKNDFTQAVNTFSQTSEYYSDPIFLTRMINALVRVERYKEAYDLGKEHFPHLKTNTTLMKQLVLLSSQLGQKSEFMKLADSTYDTSNQEELFLLALSKLMLGELELAKKLIELQIDDLQYDYAVMELYTDILLAMGETTKLESVVSTFDDLEKVYANRLPQFIAKVKKAITSLDKRQRIFERQYNYHQRNELLIAALLEVMLEKGELESIINFSAENKKHLNAKSNFILAKAKFAQQNFSEAISEYKRLYIETRSATILNELSTSLLALNKKDELKTFLANALKVNSNDKNAEQIYISLFEGEEAIDLFDAFLIKHPNNLQILNNKAFTLYQLGKKEEALAVIDKALALAPTNAMLLKTKKTITE